MCNCGETGNTCDRINGACVCNLCYSGPQCEMGKSKVSICTHTAVNYAIVSCIDTGSECFVQFLGIQDKVGN